MKSKQATINLNSQTIKLESVIGSGNFATIYSTSIANQVAKISFKANENGFLAFKNEQQTLAELNQKGNSEGIISMIGSGESTLNNQKICVLLLEECKRGSLINLLASLQNHQPNETLVMIVIRDVLQGLRKMHKIGVTHRDVKMENVLLTNSGNFKLCDFGSVTRKNTNGVYTNDQRHDIQEDIESNTTPMYRSPEQIDFYSGYPITNKVDIFALGVLMFIFCFQKPPFESSLAAINTFYFLPDKINFSDKFNYDKILLIRLIDFMKQMFIANPTNRPDAEQLFRQVQTGWNLPQRYRMIGEEQRSQQEVPNLTKHFNSVDNLYIMNSEAPLGVIDKIKRYFNELSKRTEAWVLQATEDTDSPPRSEDIRQIIIKAWMKDKIEKFYSAVQLKIILQQCHKPKVILKLLIVMHQYIKKGPPQILRYDISETKKTPNFQSIINAINTSYPTKENKIIQNIVSHYSQLLMKKLKISLKYRNLFEGNFSANPIFQQLQTNFDWQPIKIEILDDLLNYWKECNDLCTKFILVKPAEILNIQNAILLQVVDELYCLLSLFVHLFYAIKQSTNFITHPIDKDKLLEKILTTEVIFEDVFLETSNIFTKIKAYGEYSKVNKFIPQLKLTIVDFIKKIEFLQENPSLQPFNLLKYFNPTTSLEGVIMPMSYKIAIQGILGNQSLLSFNDYKTLPVQGTKEKQSKDFVVSFPQQNQNDQTQQISFSRPQSEKQGQQEFDFFADFSHQQFNSQHQESNFPNFGTSMVPMQQMQQCSEIQGQVLPQVFDPMKDSAANFDQSMKTNIVFQVQKSSSKLEAEEQQQKSQLNQSPQQFPDQQNIKLISFEDEEEESGINVIKKDLKENQQNLQVENVDLINFDTQGAALQNQHFDLTQIKFDLGAEFSSPSPQKLEQQTYSDDKAFQLQDTWIIPFNELQIIKQVASGGSGTVYLGKYKSRDVAIKQMNIQQNDEIKQKEFNRELKTLTRIGQHPNLVSLVGVSKNLEDIYIVTEYCQGGTIFNLLHKSPVLLDWKTRIQICLDVANGMCFLHNLPEPIIHRDLKSLNLLIDTAQGNPYFNVKIADFGLSRTQLNYNSMMTAVVGTFHWMAPEVFEGNQYSSKADVFSYGIFLYEVCSRQIPYTGFTNALQIMKYVTEQQGRPDLKLLSPDCPDRLKQLMIQCWTYDPDQRPSFYEINEVLKNL